MWLDAVDPYVAGMARRGRSIPRIERSSLVAALIVTTVTMACGSEDEPSAASTPASSGSEAVPTVPTAPTSPPVESSSPSVEPTDPPVITEPQPGAADVEGAALVCPAVANALALAAEAGWGPGAGSGDEAVTAALSGSLVIDLVPDLPNDQVQALWDAADTIATAECPSDAQQLVAIYGATSLREILGAA